MEKTQKQVISQLTQLVNSAQRKIAKQEMLREKILSSQDIVEQCRGLDQQDIEFRSINMFENQIQSRSNTFSISSKQGPNSVTWDLQEVFEDYEKDLLDIAFRPFM